MGTDIHRGEGGLRRYMFIGGYFSSLIVFHFR